MTWRGVVRIWFCTLFGVVGGATLVVALMSAAANVRGPSPEQGWGMLVGALLLCLAGIVYPAND